MNQVANKKNRDMKTIEKRRWSRAIFSSVLDSIASEREDWPVSSDFSPIVGSELSNLMHECRIHRYLRESRWILGKGSRFNSRTQSREREIKKSPHRWFLVFIIVFATLFFVYGEVFWDNLIICCMPNHGDHPLSVRPGLSSFRFLALAKMMG